MKLIKIVIISLFFYSKFYIKISHAQIISKQEIELSKKASKKFQEKIFSGKISNLYKEDLDAEVKKNINYEEFVKFLENITQTLGARKKSILFNYKKINSKLIRVSYMSEFVKGVSVESYYISMSSERNCFLFRYEITDPSKFVF